MTGVIMEERVTFVSRQLAADLDKRLFSVGLISPVLMELAGQSVAQCAGHLLAWDRSKIVGVLVGPGCRLF